MRHFNTSAGFTLVFLLAILSAGIHTEAVSTSRAAADGSDPAQGTQCSFHDDEQWLRREAALRFTPSPAASRPVTTWYVVDSMTPQTGRNLILSSEGIHTVRYWSVDAGGTKERPKSVTVRIDRTPPFTSSDFPGHRSWTMDPVTIRLSATDIFSGVHSTRFSVNNSLWEEGNRIHLDDEGVFHLRFHSIDLAGNREESQSLVVQIDRTPPEIILRAPIEDRVYPPSVPLQLSLEITDRLSGVLDRSVELDGDPFFPAGIIPALEPGRHFLRITAEDRAGNRAEKEILFEVSE